MLYLNVSTLTVLLVCVIAEYAHAIPYQWGWENSQQRSKRSAKYEVSVVENWQSVCEEVCGAGFGGLGCGDRCSTFQYNQKSLTTVKVFQDKELCPILCNNNLGQSNCDCPVIFGHSFAERNRDVLCSTTCRLRSYQLSGCTKCFTATIRTTTDLQITDDENGGSASSSAEDDEVKSSTEASEELTEDTTTDTSTTTESTTTSTTTTTTVQPTTTTTTQPTTPDWNQLCETLCRNGEGGSLCNCDIPPFL